MMLQRHTPPCPPKPAHVRTRVQRLPPCCAATTSSGVRMRDMSKQVANVRSQLEENEDLRVLMAGLRGSNLNTDDFAADDVTMQLVEVDAGDEDGLPTVYDPDTIAEYWARRPVAVARRITQLMGIAGGFLSKFAFDLARGRLRETEVQRAIDLRNILTSLGPAYIKLGQGVCVCVCVCVLHLRVLHLRVLHFRVCLYPPFWPLPPQNFSTSTPATHSAVHPPRHPLPGGHERTAKAL